jgi:plasmid stabilization system protein ParE
MRIRYSPEAKQDLADIIAYLRPRNRATAKRVREALQHSLEQITRFRELGRMQDEGVRKIVEPKFGYLIYNDIDKPGERGQRYNTASEARPTVHR